MAKEDRASGRVVVNGASDAVSAVSASIPDAEVTCPECEGEGWVVGIGTDYQCCGGSEWECGGAGCYGPMPVQIQEQDCCPMCGGHGSVPAQGIEARRAETGTGSVHESPVGKTDAP